MKQRAASGFTLVEMAVVLLITAIIMVASISLVVPWLTKAKLNSTQSKLEHIADALSFYAQQHGRLPCPADPNGAVYGAQVVAGGDECGDGSGTDPNYIGMVPFRDLGLPVDSVMDAWNNPITYAPSKALTTEAGNHVADASLIYKVCLQSFWMDPASGLNLNPRKARLCCPPERGGFYTRNDDVTVSDDMGGAGNSMLGGARREGWSPVNYDDINTQINPTSFNNRMIAFVLVSHGMNGDGAMIPQGPLPMTNPVTAPAGTRELENRDGDRDFVWRPYSTADDDNYFDDLILWRTNDQLISALGKDSCNRP